MSQDTFRQPGYGIFTTPFYEKVLCKIGLQSVCKTYGHDYKGTYQDRVIQESIVSRTIEYTSKCNRCGFVNKYTRTARFAHHLPKLETPNTYVTNIYIIITNAPRSKG